MMTRSLTVKALTVGFFVFSLSACLRTRTEVKDTEQKQVMQQQVVTLQRTNADTNSRLADVDEQLRELSGKIEHVENKVSKMNPDNEKAIKGLIEMQNENVKKIALLQEEVSKQETQIQSLNNEIQNLKTIAANSLNNEKASAAAEASKKNNFQSAEDLFKQGEWKKAIIQYQKYRDENPKGKHLAESTYKMAVCFQELGMKDEAKAFYDEVNTKFPGSPESKKAKTRLKSLKK